MHAAGVISHVDGSLLERGIHGYYGSTTQVTSTTTNAFEFTSSLCGVYNHLKTNGYSIRCIRGNLPVLTTTAASSITSGSAVSGGTIADDGGSGIMARGVCWSTSTGPTTALSTKTTNGTGTGTFTSNLISLNSSTLYYVRAYATNYAGTSYGNEVTFTTSFSCFIAGSKITMADGTFKNIEDIKTGDRVVSVNTETMEVVTSTVTGTRVNPPSHRLVKITYSNGRSNTCTKEHPFWVAGKGWSCADPAAFRDTPGIMAKQLATGDKCIQVQDGKTSPVSVEKIEELPELILPTYIFDMDNSKNFIVNGVIGDSKPL